MTSNQDTPNTTPVQAKPISIETSTPPAGRRRSSSVWSNPGLSPSSSPLSSTVASSLKTPSSFTYPRSISPKSANSPLAYFLAGSPAKSTYTWNSSAPGDGGGGGGALGLTAAGKKAMEGSAIAEDGDDAVNPYQKLGHARTASASWSAAGHQRGAGVMRRLSLGGALSASRPQVNTSAATQASPTSGFTAPPPTPASALDSRGRTQVDAKLGPPVILAPNPSPKRAASARKANGSPIKKRSVSPMGERMLKGFDGFGI